MSAATRTGVRSGTRLATLGSGVLGIDALAQLAGVHPELVRRLVGLGLLERVGGTAAAPMFRRDQALSIARAVRLRRDLGLNYAGAVLACELLGQIDELEARLREREPRQGPHEVIAWTRTV